MALSPASRTSTQLAGDAGGPPTRLRALTDGWRRFADQPAIRRALPSILLVAVAVLTVAAFLALREAPRSALYPGMAEADKARVMESLTAAGIAAQIDRSSGEITVPAADYHRARLTLAAQGLPQSVPDGDRVLTDLPMGASRALETARLRQAQELDLARSITEIASVQGARVHLALPERSAFLRDSHPPRASVFLTLAAGRVLDQGQVEAIVHLVSSSVPGMARDEVTVVDQAGRLLSRGDESAADRLSERQLRHRVEMETLLRRRIEAVLTPLVGPGNLSVEVTAAMDFTQREITEERVDPEGNALRSEQLSESENRDAPAGGIPGAVANTPPVEADLTDDPAAGAEAPGAIRSRTSGTTRNYEVSRQVTNTRPETGQIQRISAAVVIHAPAPDPATTPDGQPVPALPPAMLADLQRLAESAIGLDAERGDQVTILAMPFLAPAAMAEPPARDLSWLPDALRQLGLIVILAAVAFGVIRPLLMRQLQPATEDQAMILAGDSTTVEVAEGESLDRIEEKLDRRQRDLLDSVLGGSASREEKQAVLRRLGKDDPVRMAMVLHRMMQPELDRAP